MPEISTAEFQVGQMYTVHSTTYLLIGGSDRTPQLAPINATPLICRGSRGPSTRVYAHSPEMGLPNYARGERPSYKLLPSIVLYFDAEVDVQVGDEVYLYGQDDIDRYYVTATSEPRLGLRQIFGELADSRRLWRLPPSIDAEVVGVDQDLEQEVPS